MASTSPHPCTQYTPGHQVHFIQAKLSNAGEWRPVELVSREAFETLVAVDGALETWRFHAVDSTRQLLDEWQPGSAGFLSDRNLLSISAGFLFPCRHPGWWKDCA